MLFSLNATLVVFVVSFLIFMWLLNEIMLKPVGRTLEARARYIQDQIEAGKTARNEAEQLQVQYERDLQHYRQEARNVIGRAVEDANRTREQQMAKATAEGHAKIDKAKQEIEAERDGLIDALVADEKELVETITRKVLGDESVNVDVDTSQLRRTLEEAR